MKAIVLCAGLGTRLRPLTFSTAKHLLPVANKPVLHFAIESLVEIGATDIGIVVSNDSRPSLEAAIQNGAHFGARVTYILQTQPRGLADACSCAEDFVGTQPFVVYLGDSLVPEGMRKAARRFQESGANALVMLKAVDEPQRFGIAEVEGDRIVRLVEKPKEPRSNLGIVGGYFFDHHIWESIRRIQPSWRHEYEMTDAIQDLVDRGLKVVPDVIDGRWIDTGEPRDLLDANRAMLEVIEPAIAGTVDAQSTLAGRVSIAAGASVRESRIRGPVIIGAGTRVENACLGPYVSLGDRVQISNATLENCVVMNDSEIRDLSAPLVDSLIGRHVKVHDNDTSRRLLLGDYCEVGR